MSHPSLALRPTIAVGLALAGLFATSCGSQFQRYDESLVRNQMHGAEDAPVWVRGEIPSTDTELAFVGRGNAYNVLDEEAGIAAATISLSLGSHDDIQPGERWHLFIVSAADLPATWDHAAIGDDGDTYRFFWHSLGDAEPGGFDPRFLRAMDKVRAAIASGQIPLASFG